MNVLIAILAATLLTPQAKAPVPKTPAPRTSAPQTPASPAAPPPAAETPAPAKYVIGAQDQLKITVLDELELSQSYRVDSDGSISFPYLNRIPAAGLTLAELQEKIRAGLSAGYLKNPQVRIEVESYKSQSVMVSGEVRSPGKIAMTGAMTVLEALAAAGSPTSSASSELTIAHARKEGADSDITRVNWKDLQLGRGTDVALADGDILNIPKAQTFFITGQIRNSGSFVLEPGMTVQQAIAMAGGLNERGSDRRINASRLVNGKLSDVSLKMEDKVMPNDVITIGQRFF
jgi:polysaccharide export outer membrane protein